MLGFPEQSDGSRQTWSARVGSSGGAPAGPLSTHASRRPTPVAGGSDGAQAGTGGWVWRGRAGPRCGADPARVVRPLVPACACRGQTRRGRPPEVTQCFVQCPLFRWGLRWQRRSFLGSPVFLTRGGEPLGEAGGRGSGQHHRAPRAPTWGKGAGWAVTGGRLRL